MTVVSSGGVRSSAGSESNIVVRYAHRDRHSIFFAMLDAGMVRTAGVLNAKRFSGWFAEKMTGEKLLLTDPDDVETLRGEWESILAECNTKLQYYSAQYGLPVEASAVIFLAVGGRYILLKIGGMAAYRVCDSHAEHVTPVTISQTGFGGGRGYVPEWYTGKLTGDEVYLLCTEKFAEGVTPDMLFEDAAPHRLTDILSMRMGLSSIEGKRGTGCATPKTSAVLFRSLRGGESGAI